MPSPETVDLLIAGAGPAGLAAALHLVRADRRWAERMVVVEKAVHPRDKLCGGGVTRTGEEELARLGLGWEGEGGAGAAGAAGGGGLTVGGGAGAGGAPPQVPLGGAPPPQVPITELRLVFGDRGWAARGEPVFRVVRRRELDAWLLRAAEREGIEVRQGEAVTGIEAGLEDARVETPRGSDRARVRVETTRGAYRARALLGADGSRGAVRRRLGWAAGERQARLLEVLTPERPEGGDGPGGWRGVAVFDFTPMAAGVRGYYWDFPSLVGGRPVMNRGIFDSRVGATARPAASGAAGPGSPGAMRTGAGGPSLRDLLAEAMARRGRRLEDFPLEGHPIAWFDRGARVAAPGVILAGDAAGVDPLLGEGISFALAHGRVAAEAVADAFARGDFSFAGYPERLLADPLLAQLARRRRLAGWLYALRGRRRLGALWQALPWLLRGLLRLRPGVFPVTSPRLERLTGLAPETLRAGA